jgi:hypothetical protein
MHASQRLNIASGPSLRRVPLEIGSNNSARVGQVIDVLVSPSDARVSVVCAHDLKRTTAAALIAKDQATAFSARFYDVQRTPERLGRRSVQAGGKAQDNE